MSMPTGGSSMNGSSTPGNGDVFDITKAEDALAVLRRVHMSTMTPEEKNELRDAVFSVQNGSMTADAKVVEDAFAGQGLLVKVGTANLPETVAEDPQDGTKVTTPEQSGFGRPIPSFGQTIATAPVINSVPVSNSESEAAVLDSGSEVNVETLSKEDSTASEADPSMRIKDIKKEVNSLVGNPVNLIDINPEIGREYMNALLDAMKKVGAGISSGDMQRAMRRLEAAFTAVKNLDMDTNENFSTETVSATEEKPAAPEPAPIPVPVAPKIAPAAEPTLEPTSVPESVLSPEPDSISTPETVPTPEPATTAKLSSVGEIAKDESIAESTPTATVPAAAPAVPAKPVPETIPDTPEPLSVDPAAEVKKPFTAVAKEKQLEQIMKEQTENLEKEAGVKALSSDPLQDMAVTTGLEQLLSEWKLFKSSGIFGTGPSGVDHPLYKKLAPLTMAAVMTGRFDGSNSDIKQNITEYMSGWRYEEGVLYEPTETFEHYLRRVIRHILDKQKEQ